MFYGVQLPHVWHFTHGQACMWLYGLEPYMVSHHPAKFGGYRHCVCGDMFLIVQGQDSLVKIRHYCLSLKYMAYLSDITKFYTIKRTLTITFTKLPNKKGLILVTRFPGNKCWNIDKKNFCQSITKTPTRRKKKTTTQAIAWWDFHAVLRKQDKNKTKNKEIQKARQTLLLCVCE